MASRPSDRLRLPDDFWDQPAVLDVLPDRDVATLFRLAQRATGASQTQIAAATGLTQAQVSGIISGQRRVTSVDVLSRIVHGLTMPPDQATALMLGTRDAQPELTRPPARSQELNAAATATAASIPELIEVHTDRASIPRETWLRLFKEAREHIDVLVLSGAFLVRTQPRIVNVLTERIGQAVKVRMCFGLPSGKATAIRAHEEGLGDTLNAKIQASLNTYRPLVDAPGFELRLHDTTLYSSIFRFDDEAIVTPHLYGRPGWFAPAMHLRQTPGGALFNLYADVFDRAWDTATSWLGEDV